MQREQYEMCSFKTPPLLRWTSVNDAVMGGVSESLMQRSEAGTGVFAGHLSLEHNGGFASVRTSLPHNDYQGCTGIRLRVRGDGHRYSFRIRTDLLFDGVVYRQDFDTIAGRWLDIDLPFGGFTPSFRGRPVPDAPPIDPSRIYQVGLLISNRQEGPFSLEVESIVAYRP
ncbi:CIA30 family protein [Prosthecochloris sp. N3]|uniref:CIA30 family protein n=2 Tax=Prosthecochloris ethylica TaxID=2743976 RepID=A0ABR9XSZ0_9CHLB|nr:MULTISPECIES: CIA30 family protein [Prosthecochloris]MBF0585618.1 CIA30 family protein [Prosthecochloris ethylica]MBF0637089.1 CIA30 family protein [Prosthecochloris ethylica]NUK46848.1 CIA30 family protein [Prosthecochloris ethylica]RNA64579.1 CIA30 family protein [Prosthecochloris sp. ZM_2]